MQDHIQAHFEHPGDYKFDKRGFLFRNKLRANFETKENIDV